MQIKVGHIDGEEIVHTLSIPDDGKYVSRVVEGQRVIEFAALDKEGDSLQVIGINLDRVSYYIVEDDAAVDASRELALSRA